MDYVKPELLIVTAVLYFFGIALKQAEFIKDKYIPISLYELILRQLAFQNSDILNGLNYYNRQCDK